MSSAAWTPATLAGDLYTSGMSGLSQAANKWKDNEAIGGLVAGSMIDNYTTRANMGSELLYNQAMASHLGDLQTQLEGTRTANQAQLMGVEGRIAKDLINAQGQQQILGIRETGAQQRENIGAQGAQDRLNIGAQGDQTRMSLRTKGSEDRKGIVTAGQQERLNIGKRYQEERGMRADARGAIRSLGARFFG
jgi:hypothetical protein